MSPQLRMPIASNTKLLTSVALHQLQEQVRGGAVSKCVTSRRWQGRPDAAGQAALLSLGGRPARGAFSLLAAFPHLPHLSCTVAPLCRATQGLLNISSPAADYVDPADFGLQDRW